MEENWRPPSRDEFREMEARNIPEGFCGNGPHLSGGIQPLAVSSILREYLDMVLSPGEHNDHFYLAQVPIRVKDSTEKPPLASLESEISLPEFLDEDAVSNINLWMSSTSSRSSIHYDPYHNVLGVVTVTLWPPDAAPYLYPKPLYGEASNHSEVNFVEPDYQKFPRFRDALKDSRVLVVDAGSAVFIPEGWFHQVDSAALTIAVNFWWASKQSCAFDTPMDAYYLRRILVSLLDAEKVNKQQFPMQFTYIVLQRSMLGWNPHVDVESDLDDVQGAEDLTVNSLSPLETKQLHVILSCVAVAVNNGNCEDDPIASVFLNTSPRSLRRIFLTMVTTFPRSLEALVLHALSPVAAELLTKQFEEMDSIASEASQAEFYKRFYSVLDDSSVAMTALLDRKEAFASKTVVMGSLATSLGIVLLSLAVAALLSWKRNPGAPADFVITNCSIWTADKDVPWAESMAVRRGRILRVGSLSLVKVAGSDTEFRDLEGQFVVPGFIDSHVHFIPGGLQGSSQMSGFKDSDGATNTGESRMDGHMGLANKVAMDICDLKSVKEDPTGGSIVRDADGVPTGLLVDAAMILLTSCVPKPSLEQRREALARASHYAVSKGVTSVVDIGSYFPGGSIKNDFEGIHMDGLSREYDCEALIKERGRHISDWVHIGGSKLLPMDRWAREQLSFTRCHHYEDDPNNFGLRVADLSWLSESVSAAFESKLQVAVHAIGDAANDDVLGIYADAISKHPRQGHRLRVEHAQHLSPGAHLKFGKFLISASMQPEQLLDDAYYAVKKLGEKHSRGSYNLRSLLGNGSVVAVVAVNPLGGIRAAVERTPSGWSHPWIPEERVSAWDAVVGYTSSAAYAAALEDLVGSLTPGKFADFAVLSKSPFAQHTGIFPRVYCIFARRWLKRKQPESSSSWISSILSKLNVHDKVVISNFGIATDNPEEISQNYCTVKYMAAEVVDNRDWSSTWQPSTCGG
ncbi:hypothetical protein SELMODRAFT_402380 [Selaginella moellendorffii]|uniref:JmjC domain-containing protein n=1 Tax=Selaginella moellendorffii TaxID=88036 RepID=D8QQF9_SELML|nr:hypothetical protein SELMODRAFT_402380 [Selaginella moellendorffii]